ncbi:MAG: YgjV family protein [Candidatus Nanoarchaeia archaeon]
MIELNTPFIISQVLVLIAMVFDFMSFQFKERKKLFLCFIISAALISAHYFLLGKTVAGIIIFFSVLRFITCIFTTDKKFLALFIALNTIALIFTYQNAYDIIIYLGSCVIILGNFQKKDKNLRRIMMVGTSLIIIYNALIFSPMGVVLETSFLISNILGYYRFYIKNNEEKKKVRENNKKK